MNTTPDTRTPVLVVGAQDYCALGIVRSLGRWGIATYCMDPHVRPLAARSRHCAGSIRGRIDEERADESVEALLAAARLIGGRPLLLATFDLRTLFVDRHRARLAEAFVLPEPRAGAVRRLYNKRTLQMLCEETGVAAARSFFPESLDQALRQAESVGYPLVLKGIEPDRLSLRTGGKRMAVVSNRAELERTFLRFHDPDDHNLILQEYLPGGDAHNWIASTCFDRDGTCRFGITGRKLRQFPVDGGVTSLAITAPAAGLVENLQRLVRASGYHGIIDADCRFDPRDGTYKVLDINPRPGANFRALVGHDGLDTVRAHYLDLTGQEVPASEPVWDRRFMVEDKDLWAVRQLVRGGTLEFTTWLRSVRNISEFAHWDLSDPGPSLRFAASFVGKVAAGLLRKKPLLARADGKGANVANRRSPFRVAASCGGA